MNANYFTKVLLPMHIKLQGLYKNRNQFYDEFYSNGGIRSLQEKWILGLPSDIIWLPRTIDDSSEEAQRRSLWGILQSYFPKDGIRIDVYPEGDCHVIPAYYLGKHSMFYGKTLTEATLKALCAQERIEI